jgi:hypothetical protein
MTQVSMTKVIVGIAVIGLVCLCLSGLFAVEQPSTKGCAVADVRSVKVTSDIETKAPAGAPPAEMISVPPKEPTTSMMTVVALGPVLSPAESMDIKSEFRCNPSGVELVATIKHTDYPAESLGTVTYPWRPKVTLVLSVRQPQVRVQVTWKLLSPAGKELTHLPSNPRQTFPMSFSKMVSLSVGQKE